VTEKKLGRKPDPRKVHVYVATPAYNGRVDDVYSQSLAEAAFCCPLYQVYFTAAVMRGGAFIDLTRNLFVHWFLTLEELKECTHFFFIDSDLKFEPRAFLGLARSNQPICAGAYRRRQKDEDYPVALAENPEGGGLWIETDEAGGEWVMADRVPTGFLCIERKVLEEMAAEAQMIEIQGQGKVPRLFYTYVDEKGRFVGEDFAFCDDYRKKYGKPIPVWPDLDFTHGGYEGNYKKHLMEKIAEEDAKNATSSAA
jgi:hypothetical protein